MDDADVEPQEVMCETNDAVDAQSLLLLRAAGEDGGGTVVSRDARGLVVGDGGVLDGGEEEGRNPEALGSGMLGEDDAGTDAILFVKHEVRGRVDVSYSTSLARKGSVDFVNAFVGGVPKAETGGAGDAVAAVR